MNWYLHMVTVNIKLFFGNVMEWKELQHLLVTLVGICRLLNNRVLYLAMSPDGYTIVTGAGDETLRFWNIYP